MENRRVHRRSRRNRKWYRPARFRNRANSLCSGRLPPSIKTNVEEVVRIIQQLPLPISSIVLAFKRVKGEPPSALPKDCQLLEREQIILWEKAA